MYKQYIIVSLEPDNKEREEGESQPLEPPSQERIYLKEPLAYSNSQTTQTIFKLHMIGSSQLASSHSLVTT